MPRLIFVLLLLLAAPLIAGAEENRDTLFLPFSDTSSKDDSIFWISVPEKIAAAFDRGELQIDVLSLQGDTITMHDTSFQLVRIVSRRTEVLVSLYNLLDRYFAEKAIREGNALPHKTNSENIAKLKREGKKWRIVSERSVSPDPKP